MSKFLWEKPSKHFYISRSEIHVWKIQLSNSVFNKNWNCLAILSEKEKKRLKLIKYEKDYFRYMLTHYMKRCLLAKYLNDSPEKLNFVLGDLGKPAISTQQNWLNLQFNISHSHQLILIGLTLEDPIGVDVEYHTDNVYIENLIKFIFSPSEKYFFSKLASQKEKKEAFFRCWTRKEAYLKAKGLGLTNFPSYISVDMNELPKDDWLEIFPMNKKENLSWKLFPLNVNKLYTASVVSANYPKYLVGYTTDYIEILKSIV